MSGDRLFDLVRYARGYLHEAELITDDEFAEILTTDSINSVKRLESYDEMRARVTVLEGARKEVLWFAREMEKRLCQNDHKGGWRSMSFHWLIERIEGEASELKEAVERGTAFDIIHEAADVANFAMMIADIAAAKHAALAPTEPTAEQKEADRG